MNIPEETIDIIKPFISHFNKYKSPHLTKKKEIQLHQLLLFLYNDIHNAFKSFRIENAKSNVAFSVINAHDVGVLNEKRYNKVEKTDCFVGKSTKIETSSDRIVPDSYNSSVFPRYIRTFIEKHETGYLTYECTIGGRAIKIIFTQFDATTRDDDSENEVKMMYIWLTICSLYAAETCAKTLTIYIYKTPFNKNLPDNKLTTLSSEHVNTAYTSSCVSNGEIVVFRKEEWFKVFIHETFHTFGLDFSSTNSNNNINNNNKIIHDGVKKLFPIKSDFNIYEAYTETWARIINSCFYSYNTLKDKKDKKQFITNSTFCLELERMFTLYQCNKVLRFMGLNYTDICTTNQDESTNVSFSLRKNLYKENTNVFAYYILSALFINNYFEFLNWCHNNNTNNNNNNTNQLCLKFKNTNDTNKAFVDYISRQYQCDDLLKGLEDMNQLHTKIVKNSTNDVKNNNNNDKINKTNNIILSTTRMTLFG